MDLCSLFYCLSMCYPCLFASILTIEKIMFFLYKVLTNMLNLRKNLFMRKLLLTAVLLLVTYFSFGQEYKSNIAESERIKKDTCYYWCQSEGNFESVEDAEESVVDGLLTAIRK